MNYYFDIKLRPESKMRENVLLNKTFTLFHKELFDLGSRSIGVSFPNYRVKLGDIIRVHGIQEDLEQLDSKNWIEELAAYCSKSPITHIPENVKYRTISRKQANMSQAKLRRLIKRGHITPEDAKEYKAKMFAQGLDNPYLELRSSSSGQNYRLFIAFGNLTDTPSIGEFNKFGLSKSATIPWF